MKQFLEGLRVSLTLLFAGMLIPVVVAAQVPAYLFPLTGGYGLAVDGDGNLFTTCGDQVRKYSSDGTSLTAWGEAGSGPGQFGDLASIAVDGGGVVYVGDARYPPRIQVFSATGAYLRGWELYDTELDRLAAPYGLAVDGDGNVFVGERNSRLEVFTTDGTFLRRWPLVGEPYGVAVGPDGLVYVATLSEDRIQVFTPGGTLLREWGSHGTEPGQFYQPFGVAVSRSGVVYVADRYNFRVQMFTEDGLLLGQFGTEGTGPGEFRFPYGVAVGGSTDERIYVSDPYNNCRVSVFGSVPTPTNATSWGRIKTLYQ